jgi:hypothetical protein
MSSQTACKTIGHAISLASSGDTIMVAAATYKENLTINISLNVLGAGATLTIIDGGGARQSVITISNNSASVVLSMMTVRNGFGAAFPGGGGIRNIGTLTISGSTISGNKSFGLGGGISNTHGGTLTINNSTVSGNTAQGLRFRSLYSSAGGGGIFSDSTLTINNSTVSGNTVQAAQCPQNGTCLAYGGGIDAGGPVTVNNSTISGNRAVGVAPPYDTFGGGINGAPVTVNNSTISGNGANHGSGISSGGTVEIQNSILANGSGQNCNGVVTSNAYNVSSDGTCNFSNSGDRNNTDPMLGPLQYNGGPTWTQALLPGSPAIDAGNPSGCRDSQGNLLTTDQRGYPRHDPEDTGGCDMGAYEKQSD